MDRASGPIALGLAIAASGCFPDYSVREGGTWPPEDMRSIAAKGGTLDYEFSAVQNGSVTATFPVATKFATDFALDVNEVTVGDFQAWAADDFYLPCNDGKESCSLDPDGPYASVMIWHPEWNEQAYDLKYGLADCETPAEYGPLTTHEIGDPDNPMTCVTWIQAVAFCAWQGRRLPTEAEWVYAATGRGEKRSYPWGNDPPVDCSMATYAGCDFPRHVGSAPYGASRDGLRDLSGSVFEWVWDVAWDAGNAPTGQVDYSGPPLAPGADALIQIHLRNGGAYFSPAGEGRLRNDHAETEFLAIQRYADAGFRCAVSLP